MALVVVSSAWAQAVDAPDYTQSSIVHAATNKPGALAPNTIATIYGVYLSRATRGLTATDTAAGRVPASLPGAEVRVLIGGLTAPLYYTSPSQINFLIPAELAPGVTKLVVSVSGTAGRETRLELATTAPGLFVGVDGRLAATDSGNQAITKDRPALAGDWAILYATGLGRTAPPLYSGEIARGAVRMAEPGVRVYFNDREAEVGYAGLAPGFAGLYQLNVRVPREVSGPEVDVRVVAGGVISSPAPLFVRSETLQ
jgi:uncharacterized protein (TIGR03437 family)